jgi:CxxC motif-containing protein (DUF1111 family)
MKKLVLSITMLAALAACNSSGDDTAASAVSAVPDAAASAEAASRASIEALRRSDPVFTTNAKDPGPRASPLAAGSPLPGLGATELAVFEIGKADFAEAEGAEDGLGPTMNLDSCGGCHQQPSLGGSSPPVNPQVAFAAKLSATNAVPPFISLNGPVREARFVRNADGTPDGGVHALFTIAGRSDATGCGLRQPDFAAALASRNVVFRIPTPVFGAGLIEQIPDRTILANLAVDAGAKRALGIRGRGNLVVPSQTISAQPNKSGNDGTLGRFGWKAQNKSLMIFSGEAYNVEMGITNDLFPTERDEAPECQYATQPNSVTHLDLTPPMEAISSIEKFTIFMRLLAPPQASTDQPGGASSVSAGKALFTTAGCALCHTPTMRTGNAASPALRDQSVNLFSDLLLHDMGAGLADGIAQGQASGREFRTAPLWGLGQRLYFLHDGRTADLVQAVLAHRGEGSEANGVVAQFTRLAEREQQDLLNFLRSL